MLSPVITIPLPVSAPAPVTSPVSIPTPVSPPVPVSTSTSSLHLELIFEIPHPVPHVHGSQLSATSSHSASSIQLGSQFSADGLQVHEVAESRPCALSSLVLPPIPCLMCMGPSS